MACRVARGVEGPVGKDERGAGVQRAHGADDAAVAVEERHGNDDAVLLGVVKALGEELAVVHHVVVGEHYAFGQAGGAAGVLDIGDVVDGRHDRAVGRPTSRSAGHSRRIEVDGVVEIQLEAVTGAFENFCVVGTLVLVPEEERFHPGAGERVLQFMGTIGGVDIDQAAPARAQPMWSMTHSMQLVDQRPTRSPRRMPSDQRPRATRSAASLSSAHVMRSD